MAKFGDFSPVIGVVTGEGMMGDLADKGMLGIGPRMIASRAQEKDEDKKRREMEEAQAGKTSMKKGGKVSSASKRADGCAIKGKTKGRMV